MAELNLELLMQRVKKLLDSQREMCEDIREIKSSLGRLASDVASLHSFLAEQSISLDCFDDHPERVGCRPESPND